MIHEILIVIKSNSNEKTTNKNAFLTIDLRNFKWYKQICFFQIVYNYKITLRIGLTIRQKADAMGLYISKFFQNQN